MPHAEKKAAANTRQKLERFQVPYSRWSQAHMEKDGPVLGLWVLLSLCCIVTRFARQNTQEESR